MAVNYIKKHQVQDDNYVKQEKERIQNLIANELYPSKFTFPLTLQFEVTERCNVKCKHCYNKSGEENSKVDCMSPEKWKEFSRYLVSKGGIFQAVISGGEPLLLGDDLFEIMDILHDDGTSFLVISNGFLLTQEKVRKFSKYRYKWFQVSIDGVDSVFHDDFRQREGSWDRAVNGAYMISKEGIPLTIAHSVTPANLDNVEKMCKLAYELGAGSIILGQVNPSGRSANDLSLVLSDDDKNSFYQVVEHLSEQYRGRMRVERSSLTKNQLLRYRNTPNSGAIVRPNGTVRLDCMAPFIIGNVLEEDFEDIWIRKASGCWDNPKVLEYIDGFSVETDRNDTFKNYFHEDILL